jgi:hypothetical protein
MAGAARTGISGGEVVEVFGILTVTAFLCGLSIEGWFLLRKLVRLQDGFILTSQLLPAGSQGPPALTSGRARMAFLQFEDPQDAGLLPAGSNWLVGLATRCDASGARGKNSPSVIFA